MHATPLHPRRPLAALLAAAALALALALMLPATLADVNLSFGGGERGAPGQTSAPAVTRAEPSWSDNPFAYPLLQKPGVAR